MVRDGGDEAVRRLTSRLDGVDVERLARRAEPMRRGARRARPGRARGARAPGREPAHGRRRQDAAADAGDAAPRPGRLDPPGAGAPRRRLRPRRPGRLSVERRDGDRAGAGRRRARDRGLLAARAVGASARRRARRMRACSAWRRSTPSAAPRRWRRSRSGRRRSPPSTWSSGRGTPTSRRPSGACSARSGSSRWPARRELVVVADATAPAEAAAPRPARPGRARPRRPVGARLGRPRRARCGRAAPARRRAAWWWSRPTRSRRRSRS